MDRSNLAVTSQPALPPELMPPPHKSVHCHYQEWKARSSQWHIVLTNTKVLALPAMLVVLTGSWLIPSYTDDECIQKPSCSSKLLHEAGIMLFHLISLDLSNSTLSIKTNRYLIDNQLTVNMNLMCVLVSELLEANLLNETKRERYVVHLIHTHPFQGGAMTCVLVRALTQL